jgi:hypothetical protein
MNRNMLIGVIVALVVLVGGYFIFFDGSMNGDKGAVYDLIYKEYYSSCDGLSEGECGNIAECVADGMVEYLTDKEIKELKSILESSGIKDEAFVEFYTDLDEDRTSLIQEKIRPCMEVLADISNNMKVTPSLSPPKLT